MKPQHANSFTRRAKLKRLTSDDRQRMMQSRALPDDFDMTQALHSPFGAIQNVSSTSVTDTLSPVSPAGDSPFSYSPTLDGPRRSNPFGGALGSPSTFTSHPQVPRLQMHDRDPRSRPEGLTSPLRPTLSYPGQGDMNSPSSPLGGPDSNGPPGMLPYGLGYSC